MVLRRKTISFSVVCNRNCTSRVCCTRRVVVYSSHIHTRHARQHNFWVFYLSTFGTTTTTMTGTALLRTVGDKYDFVHAACKAHSFACNVHICICDLLQLKLIFSNKYHTENVCMLKKKKPNLSSFIVVAVVLEYFGCYCAIRWVSPVHRHRSHIGWYKIVYLPRKVNSIVQRTSAVTTCHKSSDKFKKISFISKLNIKMRRSLKYLVSLYLQGFFFKNFKCFFMPKVVLRMCVRFLFKKGL